MSNVKEISVFVDESGSFVPLNEDPATPYYILSMVFHNQSSDISADLLRLEASLHAMGLERNHCVHAGPLIRREYGYSALSREERRGIFQRMLAFFRHADISYKCFAVDKRDNTRRNALHDVLLRKIVEFLFARSLEFDSFDKLKIYYDNGQSQVKELLKEAFAIYSSKVEFVPDVDPACYRLFQAADLACTIELVNMKLEKTGTMSASEKAFFGGEKVFRKSYLKPIVRKRIE